MKDFKSKKVPHQPSMELAAGRALRPSQKKFGSPDTIPLPPDTIGRIPVPSERRGNGKFSDNELVFIHNSYLHGPLAFGLQHPEWTFESFVGFLSREFSPTHCGIENTSHREWNELFANKGIPLMHNERQVSQKALEINRLLEIAKALGPATEESLRLGFDQEAGKLWLWLVSSQEENSRFLEIKFSNPSQSLGVIDRRAERLGLIDSTPEFHCFSMARLGICLSKLGITASLPLSEQHKAIFSVKEFPAAPAISCEPSVKICPKNGMDPFAERKLLKIAKYFVRGAVGIGATQLEIAYDAESCITYVRANGGRLCNEQFLSFSRHPELNAPRFTQLGNAPSGRTLSRLNFAEFNWQNVSANLSLFVSDNKMLGGAKHEELLPVLSAKNMLTKFQKSKIGGCGGKKKADGRTEAQKQAKTNAGKAEKKERKHFIPDSFYGKEELRNLKIFYKKNKWVREISPIDFLADAAKAGAVPAAPKCKGTAYKVYRKLFGKIPKKHFYGYLERKALKEYRKNNEEARRLSMVGFFAKAKQDGIVNRAPAKDIASQMFKLIFGKRLKEQFMPKYYQGLAAFIDRNPKMTLEEVAKKALAEKITTKQLSVPYISCIYSMVRGKTRSDRAHLSQAKRRKIVAFAMRKCKSSTRPELVAQIKVRFGIKISESTLAKIVNAAGKKLGKGPKSAIVPGKEKEFKALMLRKDLKNKGVVELAVKYGILKKKINEGTLTAYCKMYGINRTFAVAYPDTEKGWKKYFSTGKRKGKTAKQLMRAGTECRTSYHRLCGWVRAQAPNDVGAQKMLMGRIIPVANIWAAIHTEAELTAYFLKHPQLWGKSGKQLHDDTGESSAFYSVLCKRAKKQYPEHKRLRREYVSRVLDSYKSPKN